MTKNLIYILCAIYSINVFATESLSRLCRQGPKAPYSPKETDFRKARELSSLVTPKGLLGETTVIELDSLKGPEALEVLPNGNILTGLANGDVVIVNTRSHQVKVVGNTGGRPISARFSKKSNEYIIADLVYGLMAMNLKGEVRVLAQSAEGLPFCLPDDVAVSSDGTIFLSVASTNWSVSDFEYIALENAGDGIVVAYNESWPEKTKVIAKNLFFANGLSLTKDQKKLLVVESTAYRVNAIDLSSGGDRVLIDGLPGIPDNISLNPRGNYWLTMVSPRSAVLEFLQKYPRLTSFYLSFIVGVSFQKRNWQSRGR